MHDEVDRFLRSHGAFEFTPWLRRFSFDEYQRAGKVGSLFGPFPEKLKAIQKARSDGNWGILCFIGSCASDAKGKIFNLLEDMLIKIKKHGKYRHRSSSAR